MQPLAARLRSNQVEDFFGQDHLLAPGKALNLLIKQGQCHSMILWGPPGTGKTTLAQLLAYHADMAFEALSAVLAGVKDIRAVVDRAKSNPKPTLLFIDEIHRFNKAQQDALLPFVEDGTLTLIGATTENPSFECNPALLSRCRVYVLKGLSEKALGQIMQRALTDDAGLGHLQIQCAPEMAQKIIEIAGGDARRLLNYLEVIAGWFEAQDIEPIITEEVLKETQDTKSVHFDKQGEHFYDQISALHKAVRGSDPDAALYWLGRMIAGGVDPSYLARRVVRMASEDVGNADPRALSLALDAAAAMERLGPPEGELALAQAVVYIACAPKSNAVYVAFGKALAFAKDTGDKPVPLHIRNAPTKLMKDLNYGASYQYDHDFPHGCAFKQTYFPESVKEQHFYQPTDRGLEAKVKEKLNWLQQQRENARKDHA